MTPRLRSQSGAVLVFVAVSMIGLLAFTAIVVDFGAMWVGRGQAQTAVDAAALSAMQSLAFDNAGDLARARAVAQAIGGANMIWGAAAPIQPTDVTFPACPPTPGYPADPTCVRVQVTRPLPTYFANVVGVNTQSVKAMATGRAVAANAANCLKPWVVGDKWFDTQAGGWSQTALFDPAAGDYYTPPTATDAGTGFTQKDANGNPTYHGYQMILKLANPGQGANQIPVNSSGWAMEIALNNAASGNPASTPAYNANITGCTSDVVAISPPGGTCNGGVDPAVGCLGVKLGSTGANNAKSVADFITAHDPSATWTEPGGNWQQGGITSNESPSSRIVPIAIFSVPEYIAQGYNGSNGVVRIVNIVGFFLEGTCDTVGYKEPYLQCPGGGNSKSAIVGRLVSYPGTILPTGGTVIGAFGTVIILVR